MHSVTTVVAASTLPLDFGQSRPWQRQPFPFGTVPFEAASTLAFGPSRSWQRRSPDFGRYRCSRVGPSLPLTRVVALAGGLALVGAYFMPWFASQGLLLSGQFLNDFLAAASPTDLQRFVPGTSPSEARLLRLLVDLFPTCGALAIVVCLLVTLWVNHLALEVLLVLSGLVPLLAWAVGISRLPPASSAEIGLWLIAAGSVAIVFGATFEFIARRKFTSLPSACLYLL
jgi:hypothetical protein